jgi:hypothetical protein
MALLLVAMSACRNDGGCPERCSIGATRCTGGQEQTCVAADAGCTAWSAAADCPPQQICEQDRCAPCTNPCAATDVRCSDDGRGTQQCAVMPTGCVGWGRRVACGNAESCDKGRCAFDGAVPHTGLVDEIPDYLQTDPAYGGFVNDGLNHCAPVAVSNSLIWLDDNGFPQLVDDTADRKRDQHTLITTLASAPYMNTDPDIGTDPSSVLTGVQRLFEARGLTYQRLQFQGYRAVAAAFATPVQVPDLDWIRRGFYEGAAVWLNIGFYAYDAAADTYARDFGHWVTLVGFGFDGKQEDAAYLIVHDPALRAGAGFANDYVRTERLASGTLTGDYSGLPRAAAGYHKLGPGLHLPASADTAILDGAAVLVP